MVMPASIGRSWSVPSETEDLGPVDESEDLPITVPAPHGVLHSDLPMSHAPNMAISPGR